MKTTCGSTQAILSLLALAAMPLVAQAQILPGSLGFSIEGAFINGTAEGANSILITDNNLTDGYHSGFDLTDAPSALNPSGPRGSAAFQWGEAATNASTTYQHSSALWFQPLAIAQIAPEQSFDLGHLFYRNGTIKGGTGADWVDLALTLSFSEPLGQDPITVVFGSELVNSRNSTDPVASADIVSLRNLADPIDFTDDSGNQYFLELTFKVDEDTLDGTLSTQGQFRVFEGGQGSATLVGRFTTNPAVLPIPEPSAAMIGALGMALLLRRKR